jgi:hypothetical protein
MPQAPLFAYLGYEDGQLRLYVSPQALNPWGDRVVKGRSPPAVIVRFLDDGQEPIGALKAAARYFAGMEFGLDTPEFGVPVPAMRKKRTKRPPPDVKVEQ